MLIELERALARAMASNEPLDTLKREAAALPADARALLERADPDGVRLGQLLVSKLRFERICRGDKRFEAWFERDPKAFTDAFKRYNVEVPPREYFPQQEAEAFLAWLERVAPPLPPEFEAP